jgi:hypothetical protein
VSSPALKLTLLLALSLAARTAGASPEQDLREAAQAYSRGEYGSAVRLLRPLLYPRLRLASQDQVVRAYKLLGVSYIFEKEHGEAEKQFMAILSLRPDYRLDPLVDPAAAVAFLAEVKRKNAAKIREIQERERREAERRRIEEERRRQEERRRELDREQLVIERTVVRRVYWVSFLPLGLGQLQNGHRKKGFALMGTQLALGGLSLASAIAYRYTWPTGRIPAEEYDRARAVAITQVVSGALCLATIAYGIIDALVYYRSESVSERQIKRKPTARKLSLTPLFAPRAGGIGLGLTF